MKRTYTTVNRTYCGHCPHSSVFSNNTVEPGSVSINRYIAIMKTTNMCGQYWYI